MTNLFRYYFCIIFIVGFSLCSDVHRHRWFLCFGVSDFIYKVWNDDMQKMLDELNDKEEKTDDDNEAIKLLEDQKQGFEIDGGKKKKGGKTLKKGGKHNKKHAGSVKKAFHKLFKRGGNKALPKKGGKK